MVNPNRDKKPFEVAKPSEVITRNKSIVPKNHLISNVIGNMNDFVVTRRQSRKNEMGFVCYTSQLKPKNLEETLGNESWTTTL